METTCLQLGADLAGSPGDIGPSSFIVWLPCLFDTPYLPVCSEWASTLYLLTTFSDGCLGSNNDEGRSEV